MDRTGEFQSIIKRIASSSGQPLPEVPFDVVTEHSRYMNETLSSITSHFVSANSTLTKLESLVKNRSYTASTSVGGCLDPVSDCLTEYSRLSGSISSLCKALDAGDGDNNQSAGRSNPSERLHYKVISQSIMKAMVPPNKSESESSVPSSRDGGPTAPLFMSRSLSSSLLPSPSLPPNLGSRLKAALSTRESVLAEQADRRRNLESEIGTTPDGRLTSDKYRESAIRPTPAGASSRTVRELAASSAMFAEEPSTNAPMMQHQPPAGKVIAVLPFVHPGGAVPIHHAAGAKGFAPTFVNAPTSVSKPTPVIVSAPVPSSHLPPPPSHHLSTNLKAYHPSQFPPPTTRGVAPPPPPLAAPQPPPLVPSYGGFAARAYGVVPPPPQMYAAPSSHVGDNDGVLLGGGGGGGGGVRHRVGAPPSSSQPRVYVAGGYVLPSSDDSGGDGAGGHLRGVPQQQQQQQQSSSRGPSLRYDDALTLERGLAELSGAFGRMASLVQSQGEVVCKIEDDVTTAGLMVEDGYESVMRTHEIKSGNRALIVKVFAILILLILLFRFTIARP